MIPVNQLRIGSLVRFGDEVCTVYEITENAFYAKDNHGVSYKSTTCDLQPIIINNEWLLKLGIIENKEQQEYHFDEWHIPNTTFYLGYYDEVGERGYILDGADSKPIEFVHELQTLCFILTGNELTLIS